MLSEIASFLHNAHPLTAIGLMLLAGHLGARLAHRVGAPRVTGYLLAGMALSPSLFGLFTETQIQDDFSVITDMALGVIAFSIGGTLDLEHMRRLGRSIVVITAFQATAAFLVTALGVSLVFPLIAASLGQTELFVGMILPLAILLGAISTATAPAATLAVVHEANARGPFTTVLLGVVALDDGLCIVFYALAAGVAGALLGGREVSVLSSLGQPALHIGLSVVIGAGAFGILKFTAQRVERAAGLLLVTLGCVFAAVGVAETLHASALLTCMVLGCGVVNLISQSHSIFDAVETVEELIFGLFFVLAGASLQLDLLWQTGLISIAYIGCRVLGKIVGAAAGAKLSGVDTATGRWRRP